MENSEILVSRSGRVLHIRLNRPAARNAQTPAMWRELARIGAKLPGDIGAVILSAEGRSFSAGLDVRMLSPEGIPGEGSLLEYASLPPAALDARIASFQEAFTWWRDCSVPTIAAVQGHAIGAGFQLALACDVIVAAQDASFAMREPSLGLVPDLGGNLPLVAAVGYGRALEIVASGRPVLADEALRIGLVARVVPADALAEAAAQLAGAMSQAPREAVAESKALLRDSAARLGSGHSYAEAIRAQLAAERAAQARRISSLAALLQV